MGHYASEMGYSDEQYVTEKQKRLAERVAYIKADIAARSIEEVLADILTDPTLYKIRS